MIDILLVPDSVALLLGLCALIFCSSVLQTTTGFGFAILSAPIGAALLGGPAAVGMVLIAGTVVDLLILSLRRRAPQPRWDEVASSGSPHFRDWRWVPSCWLSSLSGCCWWESLLRWCWRWCCAG